MLSRNAEARRGDAGPGGPAGPVGMDGLFVDHNFPVGELEMQPGVKWKRPKEICPSPQFIVDGASRLDIRQGKLGDCWFLGALASLTLHPPLLQKVVPLNQSFKDGYNGRFAFRFWQYGEWVEVKIDDLLPTRDNELIYLSSPERFEFWSSLLEKAYAKLNGGYRALDMGFPHEAMVDMTGGVTEVFQIASLPRNLPEFLKHLLAKGALINCANTQGLTEKMNELGIMFRHAYSLTAVEKVKTANGAEDLVRVLNPWGKGEWFGRWSDERGEEWKTVSQEEQRRLGRVRLEDGEFWMSLSDFCKNFEVMEVCHLTESLCAPDRHGQPWTCIMHHGSWVPFMTAGGPLLNPQFWQNPQFHVVLSEVDKVPVHGQETCSFIVALMQKYQRRRGSHLSIALHMYKAHPQSRYLSPEDLSVLRPVLHSSGYSYRREVIIRGALPPGRYVIIPSTAEPNQQGEFLLRVLAEKGNAASPCSKPEPEDAVSRTEPAAHQAVLPSSNQLSDLFKKHCSKKGRCGPLDLYNILQEVIKTGVLAGSEKYLNMEQCKSLVVLTDSQGFAQLTWPDFQGLWDKIRRWTDIFVAFDKNKTHYLEYQEVPPALKAAGIRVDEMVMDLIGLRYTEPNLTVSYPGFLYLVMKLESMIQKFHSYDVARTGTVTVTYKEWLRMTMYN